MIGATTIKMDENEEIEEETIDYHDPDLWHWYGSGYRYLGDEDEV